MIQPTPAAGAAGATAAAAVAERPRLAQDFDTFLTLLTTQLRNQSPTDPLNANEMTAQLVQFASVEQQIQANRNLERLVSMQVASQMLASAPLLGTTVQVESDRAPLQSGAAEIRVPRANGVSEARVTVFDANNRVLRQETLSLTGGDATWRWNGRDSNGTVMPDGAYRVAVQGTPTGGAARPLPFTVAGRVTGLEPQQGNMALALGSLTVPLDRVRTVQSAPR
jgi:flagellar basal-body rod modification protein FlgD